MRSIPLMLTLAVPAASATAAHPACDSYLGKVVAPLTFSAAARPLGKAAAVKGEFETTEAFKQRQAASVPPADPLVIGKDIDLKQVTYDADGGVLRIGEFALDNEMVFYEKVFGEDTPFAGKVAFGPSYNLDVVISRREAVTGTYPATNAMGARVEVAKVDRQIEAIFERPAQSSETNLFPVFSASRLIASIPMRPAEAQAVKPKLKAAFIVYPKWPYTAVGQERFRPRIDKPEDVTQTTTVIVADVHCGLVLDATNRVLAAIARR